MSLYDIRSCTITQVKILHYDKKRPFQTKMVENIRLLSSCFSVFLIHTWSQLTFITVALWTMQLIHSQQIRQIQAEFMRYQVLSHMQEDEKQNRYKLYVRKIFTVRYGSQSNVSYTFVQAKNMGRTPKITKIRGHSLKNIQAGICFIPDVTFPDCRGQLPNMGTEPQNQGTAAKKKALFAMQKSIFATQNKVHLERNGNISNKMVQPS